MEGDMIIRDIFDIHAISRLPRSVAEAEIRARCQSQYLGDHELLCRCLGRYKMFIDTRDVGFAPHLIMDGYWEFWITQFMVRTIKPGMVVMDVGANFGYYSLLLADLVGAEGHCVAVEPNPTVAAKLTKTLSTNGFGERAKVTVAALSDRPSGELAFYIPHSEPKNACIVPAGFVGDGGGEVISVPATSVDALAASLDRLDFIKIDAEGGEADILSGMSETLRRFHPGLLVEFNAGRSYDAGRLLDVLLSHYGSVQYIDFDGSSKEASPRQLLEERVGQDWMLYLSHERGKAGH
jgi:FkbM family methyltransferase